MFKLGKLVKDNFFNFGFDIFGKFCKFARKEDIHDIFIGIVTLYNLFVSLWKIVNHIFWVFDKFEKVFYSLMLKLVGEVVNIPVMQIKSSFAYICKFAKFFYGDFGNRLFRA